MLIAVFSFTVLAQEKAKNTANVIEKRVEKLATELSLTNVEKQKLKSF